MFSDVELVGILDGLRHLEAETEVVEFKRAENSFSDSDLGQYFSALSNEANLKGQECAWLVFGVDNRSHALTGSNYKPSRASLDEMKKKVGDQTTGRITFDEIYELTVEGRRVVMFQIPAAPRGLPVAYQGHYYGRDGESLVALNLHEIELIRAQAKAGDFEMLAARSNLTAEQVFDLLDVDGFYEVLDKDVPQSKNAVMKVLEEYGFVKRCGGLYDVTNMGALLIARQLRDFPMLEGRRVIVRRYMGSNNRTLTMEQYWPDAYAVGFDKLLDFIVDNSSEEVIVGRREMLPVYPKVAIRELLANALVHQDFLIGGMPITVEIFSNRLTITNPGNSLNDVKRLIDLPPHSRNEKLAQVMFLLHICEKRGSGYDRAVEAIESMGLPAYSVESGDDFTRVTLFPKKSVLDMTRDERVEACYQHACLLYEDRKTLNNQSVRERFGLDKNKSAMASHIISDAVEAGLIKLKRPDDGSRKFAQYIPFYG